MNLNLKNLMFDFDENDLKNNRNCLFCKVYRIICIFFDYK